VPLPRQLVVGCADRLGISAFLQPTRRICLSTVSFPMFAVYACYMYRAERSVHDGRCCHWHCMHWTTACVVWGASGRSASKETHEILAGDAPGPGIRSAAPSDITAPEDLVAALAAAPRRRRGARKCSNAACQQQYLATAAHG
jgi:hypothetical protein